METLPAISGLKHVHARRLRDVYCSADWPYQDLDEIELFAAVVLEQVTEPTGHATVRLTAAGFLHLAQAADQNRQARSDHENLVESAARTMQTEGRIVWRELNLRAKVSSAESDDRWKGCKAQQDGIPCRSVPGAHE